MFGGLRGTNRRTQQLPSEELHRSKSRILLSSLLAQNVPLCTVEHVVKKLGDVFVTAVLLSHTEMPPTTLVPLREDIKKSRWFELGGGIVTTQ